MDKEVNPKVIGRLRTKELSLKQRADIGRQTTAKGKKEVSSKYGLKDAENPLDILSLDLYRLVIHSSLFMLWKPLSGKFGGFCYKPAVSFNTGGKRQHLLTLRCSKVSL